MKVNKTIEAEFFFGAAPYVFEKARELRNNMTVAEKTLWEKIKNGQLSGLHFRRQHPINKFIADFYCHKVRLVLEADGEIHRDKRHVEYDRERDRFMNEHGIVVLRFRNEQVMKNLSSVITEIKRTLLKLLPHP